MEREDGESEEEEEGGEESDNRIRVNVDFVVSCRR